MPFIADNQSQPAETIAPAKKGRFVPDNPVSNMKPLDWLTQRAPGLAMRRMYPILASGGAATAVAGLEAFPVGAAIGIGSKVLGDPAVGVINKVAGTKIPTPSEAFETGADIAQLPRPMDARERMFSDVVGAVSELPAARPIGGVIRQAGNLIPKAIPYARPLITGLGNAISKLKFTPSTVIPTATGAAAASGAREAGAPFPVQFAAGMAGGMATDPNMLRLVPRLAAPATGAIIGGSSAAIPLIGPFVAPVGKAGGLYAGEAVNDAIIGLRKPPVINPSVVEGGIASRLGDNPQDVIPKGLIPQTAKNATTENPISAGIKALWNRTNPRAAMRESVAFNDARKAILNETTDSGKVMQSLDEMNNFKQGGYQPTADTVSGDAGLMGLGKKNVQATSRGADIRARNERAISTQLDESLKPAQAPEGAPSLEDTARGTFKSDIQNQIKNVESGVSSKKGVLDEANQGLQSEIDPIVANRDAKVRSDSSIKGQKIYNENLEEFKSKSKKLFNDPNINNSEPVNYTEVIKTGNNIFSDASTKSSSENIPPIIETILNESKEKFDSGIPRTFKNVTDDIEQINDALRKVDKNSTQERLLMEMKKSLEIAQDTAIGSNGARKNAVRFYREGAKKFINEASEGVYKGTVQPSEMIDNYMGSVEDAQQLKQALNYDNTPNAKEAVRGWWINKLATQYGDKLTGKNIVKFIQKNNSVLSEFPEIRKEMAQMANRIKSKSRIVKSIDTDYQSAVAQSKKDISSIGSSPVAKLGEFDPSGTNIENLLGDSNNMATAIKSAKSDRTGASVEGLKNMVKNYLNPKLRTAGQNVNAGNEISASSSDFNASAAKMGKLLTEGSQSRQSMVQLFGEDHVKKLDMISKQIQLELRRSGAKPVSGTDTAEKGLLTKFMDSSRGLVGNVFKAAKQVAIGDTERLTANYITDAYTNPELMKAIFATRNNPSKMQDLASSMKKFAASQSDSSRSGAVGAMISTDKDSGEKNQITLPKKGRFVPDKKIQSSGELGVNSETIYKGAPQEKKIQYSKIDSVANYVDKLPPKTTQKFKDIFPLFDKYSTPYAPAKLLASISILETGHGTSDAFINGNNAMGVSNRKGVINQSSVEDSIRRMAYALTYDPQFEDWRRTGDLDVLNKIYAPPGAENDSGTNRYWAKNVRQIMKQYLENNIEKSSKGT